MIPFRFARILIAVLALTALGSCAKNVDQVEFTKWGNSFVPAQRNTTGMDTTAQGGALQNGVTPQSPNHKVTKASVGGSYHRTFSTSPNYRMVGGFHVNSSQ
jgi:hypothetical protein